MGIIKKLLKFKFYLALVGSGYLLHSCVSNDAQYRIRRYESRPYLVDTSNDQRLEIQVDTFQVGSATYRLQGLLRDPHLDEAVLAVEQNMEAKK